MKKLFTILGLSAAATLALGGAAHAAYPPDSPGSIAIQDAICNYNDDNPPQLVSWSVTVDYTVTVPFAQLSVLDPSANSIAIDQEVPMGTGSITIDSNTEGVGGVSGSTFIVELADGIDSVSVRSPGCTQVDPPAGARLSVQQDDCRRVDPNDPNSRLDAWRFVVFTDSPGNDNSVTITSTDGSVSYRRAVPQGEFSFTIDPSIAEFSSAVAPYLDYTVSWTGPGVAPQPAQVNGCPDPTDHSQPYLRSSNIQCENAADSNGDWNLTVDLYTPTGPARFEIHNAYGQLVYATDRVGTVPEQYQISPEFEGFGDEHSEYTLYTAKLFIEGRDEPLTLEIEGCMYVDSGPTSSVPDPKTELPKTGLESGALGLIAVALLAGGGGLVWAARRREVVSS